MRTPDNSTARPPLSTVVSAWARGRRRVTPWAFPYLRVLATVRFAVGIFLAGLSVEMLAHGTDGWAAIPLAGMALVFSIACLDLAVARSAHHRA